MIAEIVLFVCLFFVYIHVMDEYKKGEDLEMLEMDYFSTKDGPQLNDACRLKQPLIFEFGDVEPELFRKLSTGEISRTTNESINVLDTRSPSASENDGGGGRNGGLFPLPFESAIQLMETDSTGRYISERNESFMDDSGISKPVMTRFLQSHFQPAFANMETRYDFLCGSKTASIPWQYHTHSRYFLGVAAGKIQLHLAPWKNKKYLGAFTKPRQYSLSSTTAKNLNVRFLDCTVTAGGVVFIPPYWWYTVTFLTSATTCFGSRYSTLFNKLAHVQWDATWRDSVASLSSIAKSLALAAGTGTGTGIMGAGGGGGAEAGAGTGKNRKKEELRNQRKPVPATPVVVPAAPVVVPAAAPFQKTEPPPPRSTTKSNKDDPAVIEEGTEDGGDDVAVALLSPLIISS